MIFDPVTSWLTALERRHLTVLTASEAARALRALSSCYVERRATLASGAPLDSAGKRAAFALFYGPLHFMVMSEVLRALPGAADGVRLVEDVACGSGAAGSAWAVAAGSAVHGCDRNAWAVAEAAWTYQQFGLAGRAVRCDASRVRLRAGLGAAVAIAYAANELSNEGREALLTELRQAHQRGARVLVLEPIARRSLPWWGAWEQIALAAGGRSDEWRFPRSLPPRQLALAHAAGLKPRELTARTLYWPPR